MGAPAKQQGFPNDSFFKEILRRAKLSSSDDWFIHDPANKIKTTYTQLLQDVLTFKATLRNSLSVDTLRVLDSSEEETGLNFFIFAPSGYYFLVAFLAILALGGVAVPLGKCCLLGYDVPWSIRTDREIQAHNINVEEASYLLQKFRAVCLLSTPQQQSTIKKILAHANKANGATQLSVELPFKDETSTDDTTALRIDNGTGFPPGRAATLVSLLPAFFWPFIVPGLTLPTRCSAQEPPVRPKASSTPDGTGVRWPTARRPEHRLRARCL